jgi:secreted trypsin-like serine protease
MKQLYRVFLLLVCMHLFVQTGNAQITAQIVGGRDANISEVPWQVLLEINGLDLCGGSIIAPG